MNCGSLIKGFSFSTTITTTTKLMQMHSVLHCILLMMSWPLSFVYRTKNQGEQRSEQTQQKKCAKFFSVSWGTVCLFATFYRVFFLKQVKKINKPWCTKTHARTRIYVLSEECKSNFSFLVLLLPTPQGNFLYWNDILKVSFLCVIITEAETKSSFKIFCIYCIWIKYEQLFSNFGASKYLNI